MTHRLKLLVPLSLITVLLSGCVEVTEPLSDPDKAEPDKGLLGTWERGEERCTVDSPNVKGNPKSLMRVVFKDAKNEALWFFTTTIGKHTYATFFIDPSSTLSLNMRSPDFSIEGGYKTWNKGKDRCYLIARYTLKGDALGLDLGNKEGLKKLMKAERIESSTSFFETPPGWLAKYLEKNGTENLFYLEPLLKFQRDKK